MIKQYSFHQLITTHIIEIPIIQRDYAQGRKIANVTYIRERFVKSLISKLGENAPLHLGFVYGKIEGKDKQREMKLHTESVNTLLHSVKQYASQFNIQVESQVKSEVIEESVSLRFIPLDGQQRLTTLFLLYWYIAMRKNEHSSWLKNFKYNNRKVALTFFEAITNKENMVKIREELDEDLNDQITEYTWYLDKWKYDATVSGALVMLQSIHKECQNYPNIDFDKLDLENLQFHFDFLDLDDMKQSDELYIKMNERGKQLTDFEHFKAWLQDFAEKKYTNNTDQEFLRNFWKNIDTVWLDFFWKNIDADFRSLDDFYFNYLKATAITYQMANCKEDNLPDYLKELLQKIKNTDNYDKKELQYIPLSNFIVETLEDGVTDNVFELFSIDCLRHIGDNLSILTALDRDQKELFFSAIKFPFVSKDKPIVDSYLKKGQFTTNYWDNVFYYFLFELLKSDKQNIPFWIRTMRNIIYNTYVQNPENLFDALKSINGLLKSKIVDLENEMREGNIKIAFFNQAQIVEESKKCLLIDHGWTREAIHKFEDHSYFLGQIDFIIKLANEDEDLFHKYANILSELFSNSIEDTLLQQALLVKGDYLVKRTNYSFCKTSFDSLRSRNENWRVIFNDEYKRGILKSLLDDLIGGGANGLESRLKEIINKHPFQSHNWQYYFVANSKALKECRYNEIRWFSENDIRLLYSSTITGYHLELRTIYLFEEIQNMNLDYRPFEKLSYLWSKSTGGHPGIRFSMFIYKENYYTLDVRYSFKGSGYELCFYNDAEIISKRNTDVDFSTCLSNYVFDEQYNHYFKLVAKDSIVEELIELTNSLKLFCSTI